MTQTQSVTVIVTRSAGRDGAVLVMIDTDFDGGDLRILLNDEPIHATVSFESRADGFMHQYTDRTLTVDLAEITDTGLVQ